MMVMLDYPRFIAAVLCPRWRMHAFPVIDGFSVVQRYVYICVCARARPCVRARTSVRACVCLRTCVRVRARPRACARTQTNVFPRARARKVAPFAAAGFRCVAPGAPRHHGPCHDPCHGHGHGPVIVSAGCVECRFEPPI